MMFRYKTDKPRATSSHRAGCQLLLLVFCIIYPLCCIMFHIFLFACGKISIIVVVVVDTDVKHIQERD